MSQFKETIVDMTCKDCYCYAFRIMVKTILSGNVIDLVKCTNKESDHYCHYIDGDHPMCEMVLQKYLKGKNKNG